MQKRAFSDLCLSARAAPEVVHHWQATDEDCGVLRGREAILLDLGLVMTPGTPILDPLFSRNFGGLVLVCIEADFCK